MKQQTLQKQSAGRPPKFDEASAPVTVTLPLRTLEALRRIDRDRAKAIVRCVDAADGERTRRIEIVKTFEGCGLIIVPPCPSLRELSRLRLVEIAPERFLLVAVGDYSTHALELEIMDLIEKLPEDSDERLLLDELRQVLSHHRRRDGISGGKILLIDV